MKKPAYLKYIFNWNVFYLREKLYFLSRYMQSTLSKSMSLKNLWSKNFQMVKMHCWSETNLNICENNSKFVLANTLMLVGAQFGWQCVLVPFFIVCDSKTYTNELHIWGMQTCIEYLQHLGNGPGQLLSKCSVLLLVCEHCSCSWWHQLKEPAGAVRLGYRHHQQG